MSQLSSSPPSGLPVIAASPALTHLHAGVEADKQRPSRFRHRRIPESHRCRPEASPWPFSISGSLLEKGEYANALPPLKRALELNPNIDNGHRLLGYALLAQGYASDAIPHLEKAHDDGALGIALLDAGRIEEASVVLQKS